MAPAAIKLESFALVGGQDVTTTFTRDDLDIAYADGVAAGQAQRQDEDFHSLRTALERLSEALALDQSRRVELREEALLALTPILSIILDTLSPAADAARMEEALLAELRRLAALTAPVCCRISCNPELRAMVQRCLKMAGLEQIQLDDSDTQLIRLSLENGRIEFSPDRVAQDIRTLIEEISMSDQKWTH